MAAIATPPPVTHQAVHSPEDSIANQVVERMAQRAAAQAPAPSAVDPPAEPVVPAAEPVVPAVAESAPVVPAELDLDSIDFDAQEEAPKPEAPSADPTGDEEARAQADLKTALSSADQDAIEKAFLRTARGRQQLESFKTLRELRKSPEEGGIGRVPTLEEIKEGDESRRTFMAMRHEFENDPVSFAANLFTIHPETGQSFLGGPEHAQRVLQNIPQVLLEKANSTQNPIYSSMLAAYSAPLFGNFFDHQYQSVLAMPAVTQQEVDDKTRLLDALQITEWRIFGKARPLNLNQQPGAPAAGPDPEKLALQQRVRQYEQQNADYRRQQVNGVTRQIENSGKQSAMADIKTLLARTGVTKIYSEAILGPVANEMYSQIDGTLATLDPTGYQTFQLRLDQATRGSGDPEAAAKIYRQLFQNALRNSPAVRQRLQDLVKDAQSSSAAQHASAAQSQNRVEPQSNGAAAPQSVLSAGQIARQPGESQEDFYTRRLSASMASRPAR